MEKDIVKWGQLFGKIHMYWTFTTNKRLTVDGVRKEVYFFLATSCAKIPVNGAACAILNKISLKKSALKKKLPLRLPRWRSPTRKTHFSQCLAKYIFWPKSRKVFLQHFCLIFVLNVKHSPHVSICFKLHRNLKENLLLLKWEAVMGTSFRSNLI